MIKRIYTNDNAIHTNVPIFKSWKNNVTQVNESYITRKHMDESRHTHEWVKWNVWLSRLHVTHMNELCHVTHINELSHVTHMNESSETYGWVKPHAWISHVTYVNEARHTHTHVRETPSLCLSIPLSFPYMCVTHMCVYEQLCMYIFLSIYLYMNVHINS